MSRLDEGFDRALVFRLVENFDGRAANILVLVADELQHGVDDLGTADLAECIGCAAADPPVTILQRVEQVFDRACVPDLVQDFHRRAPRVLVLVLQDLDEIADRLRVVRLDDDVDRLVLNVDLGIFQQRADPLHVDLPVHSLQRRQGGATDQLVGILQQPLQRRLHLGGVESGQDVDDVDARDRIFAVNTAEQLRNRMIVGDLANDAEEGGLLVRLLCVGGGQEVAHAEA